MPRISTPLDANDAIAVSLGRLMGQWAIAESQLIRTLEFLLMVDQFRAREVFMSSVSTRGKIDLLIRLTHRFVEDGDKKEQLILLLERAGKLNSERNRYVHATWAAASTGDRLTRIENSVPNNAKVASKPHIEMTAQDVQSFVDSIAQFSSDLQEFLWNDAPKLRLWQWPQK